MLQRIAPHMPPLPKRRMQRVRRRVDPLARRWIHQVQVNVRRRAQLPKNAQELLAEPGKPKDVKRPLDALVRPFFIRVEQVGERHETRATALQDAPLPDQLSPQMALPTLDTPVLRLVEKELLLEPPLEHRTPRERVLLEDGGDLAGELEAPRITRVERVTAGPAHLDVEVAPHRRQIRMRHERLVHQALEQRHLQDPTRQKLGARLPPTVLLAGNEVGQVILKRPDLQVAGRAATPRQKKLDIATHVERGHQQIDRPGKPQPASPPLLLDIRGELVGQILETVRVVNTQHRIPQHHGGRSAENTKTASRAPLG